jgi:hypothetical protein
MKLVLAVMVGYVMGARAGREELDRIGRSLMSLCQSEEFSEVVSAGRAHVGNTLRDLAGIVDHHQHDEAETGGDVLSRVRRLVGQD